MNRNDIESIIKKCKVEIKTDVAEDKTLGEIGLESLDIMMFTFELGKTTGKEMTFQPNETIGVILEKVNAIS